MHEPTFLTKNDTPKPPQQRTNSVTGSLPQVSETHETHETHVT